MEEYIREFNLFLKKTKNFIFLQNGNVHILIEFKLPKFFGNNIKVSLNDGDFLSKPKFKILPSKNPNKFNLLSDYDEKLTSTESFFVSDNFQFLLKQNIENISSFINQENKLKIH